jgi:hypothetical protein
MTFKVASRVRIKGKNVVVQRTADNSNHAATLVAIRQVGEEAPRLRLANDAAIKSTRPGYRKKKETEA